MNPYSEDIEGGLPAGVSARLIADHDCGNPFEEYDNLGQLVDPINSDYFAEWLASEVLEQAEDMGWVIEDREGPWNELGTRLSEEAWAYDCERLDDGLVLEYLGDREGGIALAAEKVERGHRWSSEYSIVLVTEERRELLGVKPENVQSALESEVKEFNDWRDGDCWGFEVRWGAGPDEFESCWGIIGQEHAESEARMTARYHAGDAIKVALGLAA